jgi:hypothetical protein
MNIKQNNIKSDKKKWETPVLKSLDFKDTKGGGSPSWPEDAFHQDGYEDTPSL